MQQKAQKPWQQLAELSPQERNTHLAAVRALVQAAASKQPAPLQLKPHLEPLMKHYHLKLTAGAMANEIYEQTGLTRQANDYRAMARNWRIPPANERGKGTARVSPLKESRQFWKAY